MGSLLQLGLICVKSGADSPQERLPGENLALVNDLQSYSTRREGGLPRKTFPYSQTRGLEVGKKPVSARPALLPAPHTQPCRQGEAPIQPWYYGQEGVQDHTAGIFGLMPSPCFLDDGGHQERLGG